MSKLGWNHRSRSVAMDGSVGDGYKFGRSLPSCHWPRQYLLLIWTSFYYTKKSNDFHTPGPSDVWVFSDEHPDSIDDAIVAFSHLRGFIVARERNGNNMAAPAEWPLPIGRTR